MQVSMCWAGPFQDNEAITDWLSRQDGDGVADMLRPRTGLYFSAGSIHPGDPGDEWRPGQVYDLHLDVETRTDFHYATAPQIVYVGRSGDMRKRLYTHLRRWSAGLDYVVEGDWGVWLALPRLESGFDGLPAAQRQYIGLHGLLPWLENAAINAILMDNAARNGDCLVDGDWYPGRQNDRYAICNGRDYGLVPPLQVRFQHDWSGMNDKPWTTGPVQQIRDAFTRIEEAGFG